MKKEHLGSDFDDFLREERLLEISEATAAKRVIAFQIALLSLRSLLSLWVCCRPES